jgi:multicomponent Na+:H+ antiporter subunit B
MRRPFIILVLTLFAVLFAGIAIDYTERHSLRPLAENYVKRVPQELGAPNIITGILLTYRGFDTLGEVAVLFMVAAGVGLVLGERSPRRRDDLPAEPEKIIPSTELVQNGAAVLFPLISIFAAYIIMKWPPIRRRRLSRRGNNRVRRHAASAGQA